MTKTPKWLPDGSLRVDASAILDALDAMDPDPEQWER